MKLKQALHWLIAAEIGLFLLTLKLDLLGFTAIGIKESILEAAQESPEESLEITNTEIIIVVSALAYFIALIWNYIRLWKLKKESRHVYIALYLIPLFASPFMGPYIDNGLLGSMESLTSLVGGMTIGLVFFSELKDEFKKANSRVRRPIAGSVLNP